MPRMQGPNTVPMPDELAGPGPESAGTGAVATAFQPMMVFTSEDDKKKFTEYLSAELLDIRDGPDRKQLETSWNKWRRQRRAVPETAERDTPWIRASNVEPPLTMQKVNTIFAKLVAAFATKKPPVVVSAISKLDRDSAASLEKFFTGLANNKYGLDASRSLKRIFYDNVSLGTAFVKVPFKIDQWSFKRTTETGTEQVTYLQRKSPMFVPVRLEDFFTRPYWKDLQRAPWIGVRYRFYRHELLQLQAQGFFSEDLETLWGQALTKYDDNRVEDLSRAGIEANNLGSTEPNQEFELYECNVFWDVDGDGYAEDVIAWIEPETGTLLRAEFNPLSVRDIEPMVYFEDPESLYGIGVCQMTEAPQEIATAMARMRIDGTQLAMLKMFIGRKGAGIGPNETLEPGKIWLLDDPQADFKPVDFPDVAQSCFLGEQIAREYADQVTGANTYMAGFNDKTVGSGATAAGTTYLGNQANSILNSILESTEQAVSNLYMLVLYQCCANRTNVDLSFMEPEDQKNVMAILSMDVKDLPTKFRFTVKTTDINKTDESRKQAILMASQLYSMYGQNMVQILGMKSNPQMAGSPDMQELLTSLYVGGTSFMNKVLEFFDAGNPDDFLPFVEQLKVQMQATDQIRSEQTAAMKEQLNAARQNSAGASGVVQPVGAPGTQPGAAGILGSQAAGAVPPGAGGLGDTGANSMQPV